jgi:Hemerythrin HHE cation binding domain
VLPLLRTAADLLAVEPDSAAIAALHSAHAALVERLVPHEEAEDAELLPVIGRTFGSSDAVAPMSRAHAEMADSPGASRPTLTRSTGARGSPRSAVRTSSPATSGLHALLELHFLQEEESYFALVAE